MPSKGKSSKGSRGSKKGTKGKEKSGLTLEETEKLCFGRRLYADLDSIFVKRSQNIALFCQKIHLYEVWNRLPEIFTEVKPHGDEAGRKDNSKKSGGSKKGSSKSKGKRDSKNSKSGGKGKAKGGKKESGGNPNEKTYDEPIFVDDRPDMPEYEPALLIGAVAFPYCLVTNGVGVFIEVAADFVYCEYTKEPPFPPSVMCKTRCFKDCYPLFPLNIDHMPPFMMFTQNLVSKIEAQYPKSWRVVPFTYDLTRKPDSILFSRPHHVQQNTGLFWSVRAFAGVTEFCIPPPENDVSMDIYKYTITPVVKPSAQRPSTTMDYNRWCCLEDQGTLQLTASLNQDVYYQGEEIEVSVSISNDSARHTVTGLSVCIEQKYTFHSEIPHDNSILLAITEAKAGEQGLPIGPKNKGWSNTFKLRPVFDEKKYNVAMDGRMSRDRKVFLAESTVIVRQDWVKIEEPPAPQPTQEQRKEKSKSKSGKSSKKKGGKNASNSSKKRAASKKGKGKGSKEADKAPTEKPPQVEEPEDECAKLLASKPRYQEENVVTGRQECRIIDIAYEVVVRLTLGNEGGQPMVRVPFVLTRNSRFVDKLPLRMPPVFAQTEIH